MRRSSQTFLKRQKELARQQRKQEKRQRLAAQREQPKENASLDADESDLLGLGLDPSRLLPGGGRGQGSPPDRSSGSD